MSNTAESGFTFTSVAEINLSTYYELTRQKVTTLTSYANNKYLLATTSYGYVVAIDTTTWIPLYLNKHHKGNISASCFADGNQHFCTASGSFSQNHDNTLNVYKLAVVADDIFVKKVHAFKNAHGRYGFINQNEGCHERCQ